MPCRALFSHRIVAGSVSKCVKGESAKCMTHVYTIITRRANPPPRRAFFLSAPLSNSDICRTSRIYKRPRACAFSHLADERFSAHWSLKREPNLRFAPRPGFFRHGSRRSEYAYKDRAHTGRANIESIRGRRVLLEKVIVDRCNFHAQHACIAHDSCRLCSYA